MRSLRCSINVTLDGCCDHRAIVPGEEPRIAGHGPKLFEGLAEYVDLKLVSQKKFDSGSVAMRYEPT